MRREIKTKVERLQLVENVRKILASENISKVEACKRAGISVASFRRWSHNPDKPYYGRRNKEQKREAFIAEITKPAAEESRLGRASGSDKHKFRAVILTGSTTDIADAIRKFFTDE